MSNEDLVYGGCSSKNARVDVPRLKQQLRALLLIAIFAVGLVAVTQPIAAEVGVFYFPGWKENAEPSRAQPWQPISRYPEKEPLLSWYDEGDPTVMRRHLEWMASYGVDYIVFDWYWTKQDRPRLNHAIENYLSLADHKDVGFSIMWTNHTGVPASLANFDNMIRYWVEKLLPDSRYKKIAGRPVILIFSPESLEKLGERFGWTGRELVDRARRLIMSAGYEDPYFVAITHAVDYRVKNTFLRHGYDGYTGYIYHFGLSGKYNNPKWAHSYHELDSGYRQTWDWMLGNSPIPYFLPAVTGWDRRPWGGAKDPLHDGIEATGDQFKAHITAALDRVGAHPEKTAGQVIVCCWNEYGEGMVLEPTKARRFERLEALREVRSISRRGAVREELGIK